MTFPLNSIYTGHVWHKRLKPREHAFKYRVFYLLQDLDGFDTPDRSPWCLSLNKFNLFSIREKDYGTGATHGLKSHIISQLDEANIPEHPKKIFMLTMPRLLGYGFNPITVFFCLGKQGQITAIIYEVHNTFGEAHNYLFEIESRGALENHGIEKSLYVSPFYDVSGKYRFRINPPTETFNLLIHYLDDANALRMTADLTASRKPLTAGRLLGLFFTVPLMTLKVVAAIHFEALRLWLKRTALISRPPPPDKAYSFSNSHINTDKT